VKTTQRITTTLVLALGGVGLATSNAMAAAPSNDLLPNARAVAVGFSELLDTTEATTDADDAELNAECGAPATDASVWYTIVGDGSGVVVDVSASDYSAGILVGPGTPGSLGLVACGPGVVGSFAEEGTAYYVLAFDDQLDGSGNGGSLSISFVAQPDAPTAEITVDPTGKVNTRTGVATLTGTVSCTNGDFLDVFLDVRQNVGRFAVLGSGGFFEEGTCDGEVRAWSAEVFPQNGKFAGGKSMTVATAFACGIFECGLGYTEQRVRLVGGR